MSLWWLTSFLKATQLSFWQVVAYTHTEDVDIWVFVLLHLIDCYKGPQSPIFPFSIKQLSSFIWLLLPWQSTNLVADGKRSALWWSPYSPLVQLSLVSLWSTGINTDYYCVTDSIFRSPLNHGTFVGCWTKWWNVSFTTAFAAWTLSWQSHVPVCTAFMETGRVWQNCKSKILRPLTMTKELQGARDMVLHKERSLLICRTTAQMHDTCFAFI